MARAKMVNVGKNETSWQVVSTIGAALKCYKHFTGLYLRVCKNRPIF